MIFGAVTNRKSYFIKPPIFRRKIIGLDPCLSLKNNQEESWREQQCMYISKPILQETRAFKLPLLDTYVKMDFAGVVFAFYTQLFAFCSQVYSLYTDLIYLKSMDRNNFIGKTNLS